jgi:hypothetical protein
MKERSMLSIFTVALVILAATVLVYLGSYWMLLDHTSMDIAVERTRNGRMVIQRVVVYRFGGDAARTAFWPAHRIDRWLRSAHWELGPAGIDIDVDIR